jgi:hypothetical protein
MTCADCGDLLLDLVYGELAPARAAEVEEHARGCAECGPQLEGLRRARKLAMPLVSTVEPPPTLDKKILEAARAEAFLLAGGTPGAVLEAKAREQARAVEAASIDARARVRRPPASRRRAWALRAAVAGSVAAVAGLVVLVSTSGRRPAPRTDDAAFRILVRAPQEGAKSPPAAATAPSAVPAPEEKPAPPAPAEKLTPPAPARRTAGGAGDKRRKQPAPTAEPAENATAPVPMAAAPRQDGLAQKAKPERAVEGSGGGASAYRADAAQAPPEDPAALEHSAEAARRQGAYAAAASLYREAARQRRTKGDAGRGSWDLAHAVECLAAAGDFAAARVARRELGQLHPGAGAAQAAADRALRTAPPEPEQGAVR